MQIQLLSAVAPWAIGLFAFFLVFIFGPLRTLRRSLLNTTAFFAASLTGDLLAGTLMAWTDLDAVSSVLRQLAVFGEGIAVIRLAGLWLFDVMMPRFHLHIAGILADILVIVGYIVWGFFRLNQAGVEPTHLFATSAILTAVFALAMQDTLGNLLGGLALQMENSLEIGDWIRIDDISGQVTEIHWRHTAIRTRAGERVVIPNSHLMKGRYTLYCDKRSATQAWRRNIEFHVDLSVPPGRIIRLVESEIGDATIPHMAPTPAPSCVLMGFGPGFARYVLRYWLQDPRFDDPTDSEVRAHVLATLQRHHIRLATDDHIIHLVKEGAAHQSEVHSREMKHRIEVIKQIELFAGLDEDEKASLAEHMVPAPFARGDILTRQGAVAHWLYIVVSGEAEAWWRPPEGPARLLEKRGAGSVFGEIGLMTGAPRRATVVATSDIEAYRLDKHAFESIIHDRPELADSISRILESRLQRFAELERSYFEERNETPLRIPGTAAIGRRIREFFGLD